MMQPSASRIITADVSKSRPEKEVIGVFKIKDKKKAAYSDLCMQASCPV
jgi:hypothetical protein